jgi:hypothetical protein
MRNKPATKREIEEILRRYKQRDALKIERKNYTMVMIGARYDVAASTVNYLAKGFKTNSIDAEIVEKVRAEHQYGVKLDALILQDKSKQIGEDMKRSPRNVEKLWAQHRVDAPVSVDLPYSDGYHRIYTKPLTPSPGPFVAYY